MPRDGGDKKKKKKTTTTAAATTTADTCKEDEKQESYAVVSREKLSVATFQSSKVPTNMPHCVLREGSADGGPMCRSAAAEEEGPPQERCRSGGGWYRKAADQGHPRAISTRVHVPAGTGTSTQSDALAVEWYRRAADQGYAPAQCSLGWMYEVSE